MSFLINPDTCKYFASGSLKQILKKTSLDQSKGLKSMQGSEQGTENVKVAVINANKYKGRWAN